MMRSIAVEDHPLLRARAFVTDFDIPLGQLTSPPSLAELLRQDAASPLQRDDALRTAIRDMLRVGGYKPTGRGKPASEYLIRAAGEGALTSINLAVDACNATSLHSGFPISVVDLDRARAPFRIRHGLPGEVYLFNVAGQEIDLEGLLCLCDEDGPCGNAVKDAQRTKTQDDTRRTLSVIWGCVGWEERLAEAVAWYRTLLGEAGQGCVRTDEVQVA
jgi:DNA/RNA-binding domain of Phe-tRNA-synthetase-like protein